MGKVAIRDLLEQDFCLIVNFNNLTSETSLTETIRMFSVGAKSCGLLLPAKSSGQGHKVLLKLLVGCDKKKKREIEVIGKITEQSIAENGFCEVHIELTQYIRDEWQYLLDGLEENQQLISTTLENLRKQVKTL